MIFEFDSEKEAANLLKHGIDFSTVKQAFSDPNRIIISDPAHSTNESRFYAIGFDGKKILTVRFTPRGNTIRIIGAGYWRKGKKIYEQENSQAGL